MATAHTPISNQRRGTVIVLVVAVLALLAVIGTVYIVSARAERATASISASSVNGTLAQRAIMNMVVQAIGDSMYDMNGVIGGYNSNVPPNPPPVGYASRNYDYPEYNGVNAAIPSSPLFNPAAGSSVKSQPWLAATLHVHGDPATPDTFSILTPNMFDPSSGTYRIVLSSFSPAMNVVNDQTAYKLDQYNHDTNPDGIIDPSKPPAPVYDAYVNLLPYNDASGIHYRFGVRILDTSALANLNIGSVNHSASIADTTGAYITSYDLTGAKFFNSIDTQSLLHTASNGRAGSSGLGTADIAKWQQQVAFQIERPGNSMAMPFDLSDELELRSYGEFGTAYHARPALGASGYTLWPNTLSADTSKSVPTGNVQGNAGRRNYTTYSFSRDIRPYADPSVTHKYMSDPQYHAYTLTATSYPSSLGNPADGFPPVGDNTLAGPMNIWPPAPARINPNPDISGISDPYEAMYHLAVAATNMATAISGAGYNAGTPDYAGPNFAINYIAQRCNYYEVDNALLSATKQTAYYLPEGPSFIDDQGICIRTRFNGKKCQVEFGKGGGNDLNGTVKNVIIGYAAQPFLNEITVKAYKPPLDKKGKQPPVKETGWAVEICNPYNQPLSLTGYILRYGTKMNNPNNIVLDGQYVPANGYLVLYHNQDTFSQNHLLSDEISKSALKADLLPAYQGNNLSAVWLMRYYYDRAGTKQWCSVDSLDQQPGKTGPVANIGDADMAADPPDTYRVFTWERASGGNMWSAIVANDLTRSSLNNHSLGQANSLAGNPGMHLFDRNFENNGATLHEAFTSLQEFNHTMRRAGEVDTTAPAPDHYPITFRFDQVAKSSPYNNKFKNLALTGNNANDAFAAQLYFYFPVNPVIYTNSPPADTKIPLGDVDDNAVSLLDFITFLDRVSDPTIDIGGGKFDTNKVRLAGKINVNTASGDVLRAMPSIQALSLPPYSVVNLDQVVANILAYRARAGANNPQLKVSYNGTANNNKNDYSVAANYPGQGFRSVDEFMIPIKDSLPSALPTPEDPFGARDKLLDLFFRVCTVRSDTFVVYGYLEAIKANPRYLDAKNNPHNNGTDWYDTSTTGVTPGTTDDPNGLVAGTPPAVAKNIRIARQRWVAIVDRSWCNEQRYLHDGTTLNPLFPPMPKVVAIKDLPK